ncbi:MAG: hypothetical protein K8T26_02230 [Lentisphaerae bacterium]|nr:hypothetical protein [Lentisphaerota bacterium]
MTSSPTELTTSATDAVNALACIMAGASLWRSGAADRWRRRLWSWVFGLVACSSVLGTIAHGFDMSEAVRAMIWRPLYLVLGILVALFVAGAVGDWRGRAAAGRLVPWCVGVGAAFYLLTELTKGAFIVFVVYEATALVGALAIYAMLAATRRLKGAGIMSLAILLNLAAAGVQASHASVRVVVPFDHNGLFHLVQLAGIGTLALGLRRGMHPGEATGVAPAP